MDTTPISYVTCDIKEFSVSKLYGANDKAIGHVFKKDDMVIRSTPRTSASLFANIGVSPSVESLFSLDEVFDRALSLGKIPSLVTLCIEEATTDHAGITHTGHAFSFKNSFIKVREVASVIELTDPDASAYFCGGIVQSHHTARDAEASFSVGGVKFSGGFVVNAPIDGYGDPSTYLKMYMGSNGITLEAPAFKSKIPMGSTGIEAIAKTIRGFRNPDGFDMVCSQMELANDSWASVAEVLDLNRIIMTSEWDDVDQQVKCANDFNRTLGRWRGYLSDVIRNNVDGQSDAALDDRIISAGVSSLIFIPDKDRRSLPVDASVMDIIKFACKVRTSSEMREEGKRKLDGYVGKLLGSRFDLAGQKKRIDTYDKFFI